MNSGKNKWIQGVAMIEVRSDLKFKSEEPVRFVFGGISSARWWAS
jgi:hypothetical protein